MQAWLIFMTTTLFSRPPAAAKNSQFNFTFYAQKRLQLIAEINKSRFTAVFIQFLFSAFGGSWGNNIAIWEDDC